MTRVLVSGASGLLGANLVLSLIERHEVIGITRTTGLRHGRLEAHRIDLAEPGAARRVLEETRPEAVVHCAAATDVDACERDPSTARRLNVDMAESVARAAAEAGTRLLHISTDAVFDGEGGPYAEDDVAQPINVYGETKLAGEKAVLSANPGALVVRTNFFGWNATSKVNLAEWFVNRVQSGAEAQGFTDVFFSPLLVNDLAGLLEALLGSDANGLLHLPGRDCVSKYDFGRRVVRAMGLDERRVRPARSEAAALPARRPLRVCLDGAKARELLGSSLPSIDDGIATLARLAASGHREALRGLIVP
ncbi:MAG TPA: SDR family oxidoreductase [Anaerolineales bacterium]|nr:SDR family oxidoreductase [Anaerolineales bacterium]